MRDRMLMVMPLLAGALLAGCIDRNESYTQDDSAIPGGAIPAAPDVRPGTQSASGNVVQSGAPAGQADEEAVNRSGATQASVDAAATDTVAADTLR
jgi:hypothetical protein